MSAEIKRVASPSSHPRIHGERVRNESPGFRRRIQQRARQCDRSRVRTRRNRLGSAAQTAGRRGAATLSTLARKSPMRRRCRMARRDPCRPRTGRRARSEAQRQGGGVDCHGTRAASVVTEAAGPRFGKDEESSEAQPSAKRSGNESQTEGMTGKSARAMAARPVLPVPSPSFEPRRERGQQRSGSETPAACIQRSRRWTSH